MRPFEYTEPQSLSEAVTLLTADPEADARVISGGTDLLSEIKDGTASPGILVSLSQVPGLQGISETGDGLSIGAMTTIAEIAGHPVVRFRIQGIGRSRLGYRHPPDTQCGHPGGQPVPASPLLVLPPPAGPMPEEGRRPVLRLGGA